MTKHTTTYLSIIIPLYNEEKRIGHLINVLDYLKTQKYVSEVVLVNDGGTDKTLAIAKKIIKNHPYKGKCTFISYKVNRGKGYAVKQGMLASRGQYSLFTDIDMSTPIKEFDKFIPHLTKYQVVIGSRKRKGAKLTVHQSKIRENLGKVFTSLSKFVLQLPLTDFTCGFKCFAHDTVQEVFSKQIIERWGFDSEIMYIANHLKYKIKEIPVVWNNDPKTKVNLSKDIVNSIWELTRIKYYALTNKY